MVEHIFALAVGLQIGRRGRGRRAVALDQDRQRRPAGAGADAARLLERRQEGVAEERIAAPGQPSHCARVERGDAGAMPAMISDSRSAIAFPDKRVGVNRGLPPRSAVRIVQL